MKHAADTHEESLCLRGRHDEEVAEVDDLHVDQDSEALMPGSACCADLDEGADESLVLTWTVRDVGQMTEDMVCQGLQLGVFLDVHHMQELLHEAIREEGNKHRAFVRRELGIQP